MSFEPHILGSGLHHITPEIDGILLVFPSADIRAGTIGSAADDLMALSDSATLSRQLTNSIMFAFDGFNHDPREVHDIPECRTYLQALHSTWPYWMHFIAPIPDLWATILLCLLISKTTSTPPNSPPLISFDPKELRALISQMTHAMNTLHDQLDLPADARRLTFDTSMAAINIALGGDTHAPSP